MNRTAETPPAPKLAAPAATTAPAPAAAAVGFPAKVYFDTGSAAIGANGNATIAAAADAIKKDTLKVAVTGYTDKTGDVAKNEELAKNRAMAVRDALKAAGVAETSIEMRPPIFVEAGPAGADAEARRVDIAKL
jgi:outer membrane protein OmpA-like peptidoglycan-associated protein